MTKNSTKLTTFGNWSYFFYIIISLKSVVSRWKSVSLKNMFADIVDVTFIDQVTFSRNIENS